jgi:hypothetical protein
VTEVCRQCGCRLARDHGGDLWCSPCLRGMRDYDPRLDPHFEERLLALFEAHRNHWIQPRQELGIGLVHHAAVKDAIRSLRQHGYVIVAHERRPGYLFAGWVAPE